MAHSCGVLNDGSASGAGETKSKSPPAPYTLYCLHPINRINFAVLHAPYRPSHSLCHHDVRH
eukprot:758698-Rhodomonas_salina.4